MSKYQDIYEAHQRARFMRPDAARYMRPDAARFIRPDVARFLKPGTDPADVFPALDRKYSASQRRVPAGRPGGGRWTDEEQGGGGNGRSIPPATDEVSQSAYLENLSSDDSDVSAFSAFSNDSPSAVFDTADWTDDDFFEESEDSDQPRTFRIADNGKPILNEFGEPYYRPGGHHEFPRKIYDSWDLSPETRQVFEESTTGRLPIGRVSGPAGEIRGHYWDSYHRDYTDGVTQLSNRFLKENDIMETRQMTPDQARDLLAEIRRSEDPAVRDYNRAMRYISRVFRSGSGRGNQ